MQEQSTLEITPAATGSAALRQIKTVLVNKRKLNLLAQVFNVLR
jgi:hypothetical protein